MRKRGLNIVTNAVVIEEPNNYIIEPWGINSVLKKKKMQRTREDIDMINESLMDIDFLALLKKKIDNRKFRDLLSEIRYKHALRGEYLYNKGDKEDNFYIILNGHVIIEKITNQELQIIKDLRTGESFGELSLSDIGGIRKYNAMAIEDSQLAIIDKKAFLTAIDSIRTQILRQIDDIAQNSLFTSDWSTFALMSIAFHFTPREYSRESFIYREGDPATEVYFLRSGQVECSKSLENHLEIVEDGALSSARRLKWAHLALWTDFAIFGYEEFCRISPSMFDNVMGFKIKREASVEVVSDKAEVWSMSAQAFINFFNDHKSKLQDLVSLMKQRLKRREQLFKQTLKLENKARSYARPISPPLDDSPIRNKLSSKLILRELPLDNKHTLTDPEIKKYDYLKYENSVLLVKKTINETKMVQTLPPVNTFFSKKDMLDSQVNTLETLEKTKKDYSIDLKPLSPPYILEDSPRSPRVKEMDSKLSRPNPLRPYLKPLHPRDSNSTKNFAPYMKTPISKKFQNNMTFEYTNSSISDLEENSSNISTDRALNNGVFITNFNKKLVILEPLKLNDKESENSFIIKNSNPKSPYKSSYKNYLEHKSKLKKYIKWKNPLKFKQINDEITKKNPFRQNPASASPRPE